MATVTAVRRFGNSMSVEFDDGTRMLCYDTGQDFWVANNQQSSQGSAGGDDPGANDPTDGDNGGSGGSEDTDAPTGSGTLYNPWKAQALSAGGDWQSHVARTGRGGADYPFGNGTPIKAPADGTLHTTGGSGDYAAGNIGSAGLRSILYLDKTYPRKKPRGSNEAAGPMRAVVFQHQSSFKPPGKYNRGDIVGYTGNTGNGVYHLHVHGLDRGGSRVDFLKFF